MRLVSELRRRNVIRMAVLYAIAAWLIMQVAEVVIGLANLPEWIGQAILGLLAVGFPIALIFSWFYELTPEGISLEKEVGPGESSTHVTGRRLDFLVISLLCAAVILFAYDKWWTSPPPEQSIAVLPFKNMSPEMNSVGFLAIGIQDGLLTRLSKMGALKVISRTSAERYRDTDLSVSAIGAELGVANVLEGSVQVIGGKLRVNAQLIDTSTDEHRWAEIYDRDLTAQDIFSIQSEIVTEVVSQISNELSVGRNDEAQTMPTQNLDAYMSYMKGKTEFEKFAAGSNDAAIEYFEAAIAEDPAFALAYVGLAGAYLESDRDFRVEYAEVQLTKAFQLDRNLGEAFVVRGTLRHLQNDFAASEEAYNMAINLEPGNSRAYRYFALLRWAEDRDVEALTLIQQAFELNPNSAGINFEIARLYDKFGRFNEAMTAYKRAMELEPERYYVEVYIAALHYLALGEVDESFYWYHRGAARKLLPSGGEAATGIAYLEIGEPDSAKVLIERGRKLNPRGFWPLYVSLLHSVYMRDKDKTRIDAMALLEAVPRASGALRHLRNADLAAGRFEVALSRYARAYPELVNTATPDVNADNYWVAIDLALVLQRLGEHRNADELLSRSFRTIQGLPRMGNNGFWVADAQVHALRGDTELALNALGDAIAEHWRVKTWYHFDLNPNFESIREEPEFQRLRKMVNDDLARQAQRFRELKASGDIFDLSPIPEEGL